MGLMRKLEEATAKKLRRIFLNADKCADYAATDVTKLEKALAEAKIKAAEESRRAHQAAIEAAEKAQKVANELKLEAKSAEERAFYHESLIERKEPSINNQRDNFLSDYKL